MLAAPPEAVIEHQHVVGLAMPFADQPRAGPELHRAGLRQVAFALNRLGQVSDLAPDGRAQSAQCLLLQLQGDRQFQQVAADPLRRMGPIEPAPLGP